MSPLGPLAVTSGPSGSASLWAVARGHTSSFSSHSYSALCAPAVPGAARGEQQGQVGTVVAAWPLLTPVFPIEPEGDTAHHPAEGPIHPHRCRWGSPSTLALPCQVGGGGWRGPVLVLLLETLLLLLSLFSRVRLCVTP